MSREIQFLLDMLQSAELVVTYIGQCSKDEFIGNVQLQDSVIRRLLIMAEAARRVPETNRQTLPHIPWREINGMRNQLVHEYDAINLDIIWDVIQSEIPPLIANFELNLESFQHSPDNLDCSSGIEKAMQIDFHHGVTYCIARLAGFDQPRAEIIAHSAQYVDDAIEEGPVRFDNGQVYKRISSAHKTLDYRNFEQLANQQVWIPFHFLPGNGGMPAGQHISSDVIDRSICSPNSHVAQDMLRECIRRRHEPHGLHRLGISMHVFADTWAHQGFTGVRHKINRASELLDEHGQPDLQKRERVRKFFSKSMGEQLLGRVTGFVISEVLPLGHGAVLSYPDKPFLKWGYTNGLGQVVQRDNPQDFLEAAQQMCIWMQRYLQGDDRARVPGLAEPDRNVLVEMINGVTDWEIDTPRSKETGILGSMTRLAVADLHQRQ